MSARDRILKRLHQNRPEPQPYPEKRFGGAAAGPELAARFAAQAHNAGSTVHLLNNRGELPRLLRDAPFSRFTRIWNALPGVEIPGAKRPGAGVPRVENGARNVNPEIPHAADPETVTDEGALPDQAEKLELVLVEADLGVSENAAAWISFNSTPQRVLPFITSHLILLLPKRNLVDTMHDAFDRLQGRAYGFGVFIAGPSKTADIEQRLVLGAHGPLTLTICLTEEA